MINKELNKTVYHFNIFRKLKLYSFCIFDLNEFYRDYPQFLEKHAIDFYAIIFVKDGEGNLYHNDRSYFFNKTSVILIPPYKQYLLKSKNIKGSIILFCQDFYTEEFTLTRLLKVYASPGNLNRGHDSFIINPGKYCSEFDRIFSLILKEYSINQHINTPFIIRSYLNILFLKLIELKYENLKLSIINNEDLVVRFSKLLEENIHKKHDVEFYAYTLGISSNKLNIVLKDNLNISAKRLIINKLMSESRVLLMTSDMSSSEIAYKLNFSDNSYFTKVFKKYHKLTPGRFRLLHQKYHK